MQEDQFKEELNRKVAWEMELMENFKLQQQRQEELMRLQKEEYKKGYQGLQDDQVTWQENQKEKDRLVEELREVLKKNQEEAREQLGTLKQQMGVQESKRFSYYHIIGRVAINNNHHHGSSTTE